MDDDRAGVRCARRTPAGVPAHAAIATPGVRSLSATRLILVCQGATAATRAAAFPTGAEPLDARAEPALSRLGQHLGRHDAALAAPAAAARDTAARLAPAVTIDPALRDCDYGAWSGRSIAEIGAHHPDALALWLNDPAAAPHGGEALADMAVRLRAWLDARAHCPGTVLAVAPGSVLRALLVAALDLPLPLFWRLDATPLTISRLTAQGGRWRLAQFSAPA